MSKLSNSQRIILAMIFLMMGVEGYGQQPWVGRESGGVNSTGSGNQGTRYLGDPFPKYNYYTNGGWDNAAKVQVGYGQTSGSMTWVNADWEADSGSNKLVKKEGFGNFNTTGDWYFVGRYSYDLTNYAYNDETVWTSNQTLDVPGNSTYYTVNALNTPTSQTATPAGATSINLSWAKDVQNHNVMIVRSTDNSFTAPTQGIAYAVNATLGGDTVIYNSGNETSFIDTGLTPGTTYYYAFYSENYSYYSTSVTASATTTAQIVSAKAYFKIGVNATQYYGADLNTGCDPGQTSDLKDGIPTVGTIYPGQTLGIGGNLIGAGIITGPKMNFKMYREGSTSGGFTQIDLTTTSSPSCGTKKERDTDTSIATSSLTEGSYIIEIYYEQQGGVYWSNNSNNYKARFYVMQEPDVFETYAFIKSVGVTTTTEFYELDAAYGSALEKGFIQSLGTFAPGTNFYLGAEMKTFKTSTEHKICDCSSWYYIYRPAETAPIATNFPLPASGTNFTATTNGLFLKSATLSDISASETTLNAVGSTSNGAYNDLLGTNAPKDSRVQKFQNQATSADTEMIFPTCIGDFKIAVALLSKISSTGDCSQTSSLYYRRDINEPKTYNMGTESTPSLVNLNPSHPTIETNSAVKNSQTDIFYTTSIKIEGNSLVSHTWNGSVWTPSTGFDNGSNLKFEADYIVGTNAPVGDSNGFTVNSIQIANGITVTIPDGKYIKVFNEGNTNATGKLVIANQGNFVQSCNEAGITAPKIEHTKTTRSMSSTDYVYWGAPVSENVISQFPAAFDYMYKWVSGGGVGSGWVGLTTTKPAEGFITRVQTAGVNSVTFSGTANNGILTTPISRENATQENYNNFALLANPYPCAIDAKTLIEKNSAIESTLYFWTSITPIANVNYTGSDPYLYNYNPEDYATWNLTGGVGTGAKAATAAAGVLVPTGKIASGQGFFVEAKNIGTANVTFDNTMRLTENVNTQFFKTAQKPKNPSNKTSLSNLEEGRIWLNISNPGHFRQILLGYMNGATNGFDGRFDGEIFSDSPILLYSILDDKDLVIQGRQLPFDENEIVSIGYEAAVSGDFYINIDQVDGFFETQNVYLKDNLLGIEHDLKQSAYLFSTAVGKFNDRFELKYTGKTLGLTPLEQTVDEVLVSTSKSQLKVNSTSEEISSIVVYDITGKMLMTKSNIGNKEITLDKLTKQNQVLLIKVKLSNNQEFSKKVIF